MHCGAVGMSTRSASSAVRRGVQRGVYRGRGVQGGVQGVLTSLFLLFSVLSENGSLLGSLEPESQESEVERPTARSSHGPSEGHGSL